VEYLSRKLAKIDGLRVFQNPYPSNIEPGYYKLGLQYSPAAFDGLSRDDFSAAMRAEGVALDPGFRALHLIHSSRRFRNVGDLPNATDADARILTLHHPVLLESEETLDRVVEAIHKVQLNAADIRDR
jgi:dTDP-4-amino-4,6-dideoxygalactose transaminase